MEITSDTFAYDYVKEVIEDMFCLGEIVTLTTLCHCLGVSPEDLYKIEELSDAHNDLLKQTYIKIKYFIEQEILSGKISVSFGKYLLDTYHNNMLTKDTERLLLERKKLTSENKLDIVHMLGDLSLETMTRILQAGKVYENTIHD